MRDLVQSNGKDALFGRIFFRNGIKPERLFVKRAKRKKSRDGRISLSFGWAIIHQGIQSTKRFVRFFKQQAITRDISFDGASVFRIGSFKIFSY